LNLGGFCGVLAFRWTRALARWVVTVGGYNPGPMRLGSLIGAFTPARGESAALTHQVAPVAPGSGASEALSLGLFVSRKSSLLEGRTL
jgi:hypothetical protein